MLGISKRGNPYLRKMFIHGARAAVLRVKRQGSTLGKWMSGLETRAARNVVIVTTEEHLIPQAIFDIGNAGVEIVDIDIRKPTLEDVFLQIARGNGRVV